MWKRKVLRPKPSKTVTVEVRSDADCEAINAIVNAMKANSQKSRGNRVWVICMTTVVRRFCGTKKEAQAKMDEISKLLPGLFELRDVTPPKETRLIK